MAFRSEVLLIDIENIVNLKYDCKDLLNANIKLNIIYSINLDFIWLRVKLKRKRAPKAKLNEHMFLFSLCIFLL